MCHLLGLFLQLLQVLKLIMVFNYIHIHTVFQYLTKEALAGPVPLILNWRGQQCKNVFLFSPNCGKNFAKAV